MSASLKFLPLLLLLGLASLLFRIDGVIAAVSSDPAIPAAVESKPVEPARAIAEHVPASRAAVAIKGDLSDRRAELEERSRQLDLREKLVEAAEKRVDSKIAELKAVQGRIQKATGVQVRKDREQFESLVKVYETMRPKDAARIFERLELPVQAAVARNMRESRMAAILAEMSPEAAKALTMELAAGVAARELKADNG